VTGWQKGLHAAAKPFGYAAAIFLVFMTLYTTISVALRYAIGATFIGHVDYMILAFGLFIFLGIPAVTLKDEHVSVDLIDHLVGAGTLRVLRWIGLIFTAIFLAMAFYYSIEPALEKLRYGETSMSIQLNRFWYRVSILVGLSCATVACLAVMLAWIREGQPDLSKKPVA